jgi:hypothetical protein
VRAALAILFLCAATSAARADAELPIDGVSLSLPSIDGATGAEVGAERFVPEHRLGLVATLGARKTAAGDYSGVAGGAGVEARWYWHGLALWSHPAAGAHGEERMVGWFLGGRGDLSLSRTRDLADARDLGTTLSLGVFGLAGYRIAPWRGLTITGDVGLGFRNEHDLRGRLPPWTMGAITVGLEVGWMF